MHPLDGAFLKLRRAQNHLDALQGSIQRWKDSKPYKIAWEMVSEGETLYYLMKVKEQVPVPMEFSLIIGDICNNLRSVLDYILWQLWLCVDPSFARNVTFPICDAPADFKANVGRHNNGLPKNQIALIEGVQPYKTGNKALAVLRDLNNRDKHRMIRVLALTARNESLELQTPPGYPGSGYIHYRLAERVQVKDGAVLGSLDFPSFLAGAEVKVNAQFSLMMVFTESLSADNLIIDVALQESISAVHAALLQFESEFPGASTVKG